METQIKDLTNGSTLYALIKGEDLKYIEGTVTNIGTQRNEFPKIDPMQNYQPAMLPRMVVDLTYSLEDKTYTDAVEISNCMFPTDKPGAITLVATSVEPIVRELKASLKSNEDYLKETEKRIPNAKKKIQQCNDLIAKLDVEFAQKQQIEKRITKLEEAGEQTNALLQQILNKLG